MEYLEPIYEYILSERDISFKYAHLLERAWGLFFASEGYETVPVIKDSHSQSKNYDKQHDDQLIEFPILTTALERNVNSFAEVLKNK